MIAALFVAKGGCYYELPNVDPWDSADEWARAIKTGMCQRLSAGQRAATPPAFRDLLISIAEGCRK